MKAIRQFEPDRVLDRSLAGKANQGADKNTANRSQKKPSHRAYRQRYLGVEGCGSDHDAEENAEDHRRGAIVKETFSFPNDSEAQRRAQFLEERQDRNRIGG